MDSDIDPERINELDTDGRPPIVAAAYQDDHELIRALLHAGADIDAKSHGGRSALFTAMVYGQTDTAKLLISSGADLSDKDEILLAAVAFRSPPESIRLLLQSGANPNYAKHPPRAISGQRPLPLFSRLPPLARWRWSSSLSKTERTLLSRHALWSVQCFAAVSKRPSI